MLKFGNEWILFCVLFGIFFCKVYEMIIEIFGNNFMENKIMKVSFKVGFKKKIFCYSYKSVFIFKIDKYNMYCFILC